MTSSNVFKISGGMGAIASGILLFIAHLLNLFSKSDFGTMWGVSLVFSAHIILVFAFIGLYGEQTERNGLLGAIGMMLGVVGTILVSSIVFVEIAGSSGMDVSPIFNTVVPSFIHSVGTINVCGRNGIIWGISDTK